MSLVRINRNPSARDLRIFASLWLVFLGGLGAFLWRQEATVAAGWIGLAALAVFVPGMVAPRLVRVIYLGAVYATFPIGFVVSHLILGIVYYLVLTPIGLVLRLSGHDPLTRRFEAGKTSYWKARGAPKSAHSYFRQH